MYRLILKFKITKYDRYDDGHAYIFIGKKKTKRFVYLLIFFIYMKTIASQNCVFFVLFAGCSQRERERERAIFSSANTQ